MIKNIIFDWGGVILTLNKERCLRAFSDVAGVPDFGEYLTPYLQKGFFAAYENGDIDDKQFCKCVKEISNKPDVKDSDIEYALDAFLEEIPKYKVDFLMNLKQKYNLYVLSNNNPICWRISKQMFEQLSGEDVNRTFKQIFLSFELNRSKPGKEIFLKVLDLSGLKAEECLFVDDAKGNIDTAAGLGFKTMFYDVNTNLEETLSDFLKKENGI